MRLSPIDAIAAILLFIIWGKSEDAKDLEAKVEDNDKLKKDIISQGKWDEEIAQLHVRMFNAITREFFKFWIGPRSFMASLCGCIATLALGYTAIPGLIVGFGISSPKVQGLCILAAHAIFQW